MYTSRAVVELVKYTGSIASHLPFFSMLQFTWSNRPLKKNAGHWSMVSASLSPRGHIRKTNFSFHEEFGVEINSGMQDVCDASSRLLDHPATESLCRNASADIIGRKKWFYAAMTGTFTLAFSTGLVDRRIHVLTVKKNLRWHATNIVRILRAISSQKIKGAIKNLVKANLESSNRFTSESEVWAINT